MSKKILLNKQAFHFLKDDLPFLIHGDDGHGASLFSVSVMADLYTQGANLLFLCGYHMARDEFITQTDSTEESKLVTKQDEIKGASSKRVIFVAKETPEFFIEMIKTLPDINERIIFFKNFDLFDASVFEVVENLPKLVLMGDIDKCPYKDRLMQKSWVTRAYFSVPNYQPGLKLPELPKYSGYLFSADRQAVVSLV